MSQRRTEEIGQAMARIAENPGNREEELVFNPVTGELEVKRAGEVVQDRDALPATEMAREGFFAQPPTLWP